MKDKWFNDDFWKRGGFFRSKPKSIRYSSSLFCFFSSSRTNSNASFIFFLASSSVFPQEDKSNSGMYAT